MMREWYFQSMGQEIGPLSAAEIKAKVANGQIQPDTLIRKGTDGKWVFGGSVKGLFAAPVEPPPPAKPKSSMNIPTASGAKPGASAEMATRTATKASSPSVGSASFSSLAEKGNESRAPSLEFYDFVGFREAVSPVLFDAAKQFASDHGITLNQLNRRALAKFIDRPDLAGDLLITEIDVLPQAVNDKWNQDGSQPLSDDEKVETATFRFTLFNNSQTAIQVTDGAFHVQNTEERTYDSAAKEHHPILDHTKHIPVKLNSRVAGEPIKVSLDLLIPPQSSKDIVLWFHADSKPNLMKIRGHFAAGHGQEFAISEPFTVTLHGDSPN